MKREVAWQHLAARGAASIGEAPRGGRADGGAAPLDSLTVAERRVLEMLAEGLLPKEAARELKVALPTVRTHIAAAKRKAGARTIEQLVGMLVASRLAQAPPASFEER